MDTSQMLNEDVLLQIFACLSQPSLLKATLACKRWHGLARQIIDSTVTLALAQVYEERNLNLFRRIHSDEALRKRIKKIVVRNWNHSKLEEIIRGDWPWLEGGYFSQSYPGANEEWWQSTREQVEGLATCLGVLELTSFTWAAIPSLPETLALVLRAKQQGSLTHVVKNELWADNALWAYSPFLNHHALANLYLLPNLVSLELLIAPPDSALLQELGLFLAARNNTLQSLKLTAFGRLWAGSKTNVIWNNDLSQIDDPRLFLVRSIDWLTKPLQSQGETLRLRDLALTNFCICETYQPAGLDDVTDLQRLVSLDLSCFGLLTRCRRWNFPSLRTLSLGCRNGYAVDREKCISDWPAESVRAFLPYCTGLRRLELVDRPNILSEDLLEAIGSNLTVLDVHQSIPLSTATRKHFSLHYPIADADGYPDRLLGILSKYCRELKQLTINVTHDWPQFDVTIDNVAKAFPELRVLHLYRQVEPYNIREGEATVKGFNKSSMLPIWDRYHTQSVRPLTEMTLHLQNLTPPSRYNQIYRLWRIPARTYLVSRGTDEGLGGSSIVRTTMLEFEQTTREALEKAPQQLKGAFPSLCRQLEGLCNEGPLNTSVRSKCYIGRR